MNTAQLFARIKAVLDYHLLTLGDARITIWTLIYFTVLFLLLSYFSGKLRKLLNDQLLAHTALDAGARQAVSSLTRYVVLFIGLLIILQTVGINLTTLNVLAGAVGIGVGFGLQNIASNFISGLIILFERPIKVGDRIEVGNVEGDVVEIGARSTTVVTPNNIAIIVPNSNFITEPVINWKYSNDSKVRFEIPIGVAYSSDVQLVKRLLLEVAKEHPDVLKDPAPDVCFREFGDSSMNFLLRVWNRAHVHNKLTLFSALNFAIHDKFQQHGIEIPFPQRVVHLRRGAEDRKIEMN